MATVGFIFGGNKHCFALRVVGLYSGFGQMKHFAAHCFNKGLTTQGLTEAPNTVTWRLNENRT